MNLSAGLDFETRLFYKKDAAAHLREELNRRSYKCSPINLGANTDPYQPLERKLGVTRSILEVLAESHHPVTIVTKHALVVRDIDVLSTARRGTTGQGVCQCDYARRRAEAADGAASGLAHGPGWRRSASSPWPGSRWA